MRKLLWAALVAVLSVSCSEPKTPAPAGDLSKQEAAAYRDATLIPQWKDSVGTALGQASAQKEIRIGSKSMKIWWAVYGAKPKDGRSLYISLHGGGGTTPEENDGQWDNQKRLYYPEEGVYLCPRAIQNTWDLHFTPGTDAFYKEIIHMAVALWDVNPDKVYLMGYSAGGDGVWRLAPRLADHWAAASMMAGHPGDVSLVNLRNTPFMIWCGADDSAYDRNLRCQERIDEMAALQKADPEGYTFEGHILPGKGHWMDGEDAAAVPWMAAFKRNPYPKKIVWKQEEVLQRYFYWIGAPDSELSRGKEVVASVSGNTISIEKCDYSSLQLFLDDSLLDLDQPVKVASGDTILFEGSVPRRAATMQESLHQREDIRYASPAILNVIFK